jgi:hypothetical protein
VTRPSRTAFLAAFLAALVLLVTSACGTDASSNSDPAQVDATTPPAVGACRNLTAKDLGLASNATRTVACSSPHDAETFAVGRLPGRFADASYGDSGVADWAYATCERDFVRHLGSDESTAMRSLVSWVWFRPSSTAWGQGARWYRCDLIGGDPHGTSFVDLPTSTKNLLRGSSAGEWMACVSGPSVAGGTRVPCTQPHGWRAVTTIELGTATSPYPGDAAVVAKTKAYCSTSVRAWLGYPASFSYGYTYYGAREWQAGNRRSVCWARTSR